MVVNKLGTLRWLEGEEPAVVAWPIDVALVRLSFLVQSVYAQAAEEHDLTPAQGQLLCVLKDRPRGMSELVGILGLERPGLTGLVDRVQDRGLLVRAEAPHDRRVVVVTLTRDGQQVADRFYSAVSGRLVRLVEGLTGSERRGFETICGKLLEQHCVPAVFGDT